MTWVGSGRGNSAMNFAAGAMGKSIKICLGSFVLVLGWRYSHAGILAFSCKEQIPIIIIVGCGEIS